MKNHADPRRAKRRAWLCLLAASVLEIVFVLATNASHAFTRLTPSVIAVISTLAGMVLLSRALRQLEVSIGYTVWVGIGATGAVIFGALLFGDALTLPRVACFVLIIGGVIGLKLADHQAENETNSTNPL